MILWYYTEYIRKQTLRESPRDASSSCLYFLINSCQLFLERGWKKKGKIFLRYYSNRRHMIHPFFYVTLRGLFIAFLWDSAVSYTNCYTILLEDYYSWHRRCGYFILFQPHDSMDLTMKREAWRITDCYFTTGGILLVLTAECSLCIYIYIYDRNVNG